MFKAFIQQFFPDMTKSIPALIVWGLLYAANAFLVMWGFVTLFPQWNATFFNRSYGPAYTLIIAAVALVPWSLEAFAYYTIRNLFR